jgi:hypothetical protein
LLVWLSILIIYRVKGWEFPAGSGARFLKAMKGSGHVLNAFYWGVLGGMANLAVDIDYLLHQGLEFPYRFWHTPVLFLGAILTIVCVVYLWRTAPNGRRIYASFPVMAAGLSFATHVLEDYLPGWF